jgi:hypothetical protein
MTDSDFQFRIMQAELDDETKKSINREIKILDHKDMIFWIFFFFSGLLMAYLLYQSYQCYNIALYYRELYLNCYDKCSVLLGV